MEMSLILFILENQYTGFILVGKTQNKKNDNNNYQETY